MSVKSTVASTRSGSGAGRHAGQELLDLVEDRVRVAEQGMWSSPGSSTNRAPGMRSAT